MSTTQPAGGHVDGKTLSDAIKAILEGNSDGHHFVPSIRQYLLARQFGRAIDTLYKVTQVSTGSPEYLAAVIRTFVSHSAGANDHECLRAVATSQHVLSNLDGEDVQDIVRRICKTGMGLDGQSAFILTKTLYFLEIDMTQEMYAHGLLPDRGELQDELNNGTVKGRRARMAAHYLDVLDAYRATTALETEFAKARPAAAAAATLTVGGL